MESSSHKDRGSSPKANKQTPSRDPSPTVRSAAARSSQPPSLSTSPLTSRNSSPVRQQAASPKRLPSSNTSPAVIPRALSATNVPQLLPAGTGDTGSKLSRTPRASSVAEPHQQSGRLKSPGPSQPSSRRNSQGLRLDQASAPLMSSTSNTLEPSRAEGAVETQNLQTPKATVRGPSGPKPSLETVQEVTSVGDNTLGGALSTTTTRSSDEDRTPTASVKTLDATARAAESDGDGNKSDGRAKKETPQIEQLKTPRLASNKNAARSKQGDGTRNMTVETETVPSIPQSAISQDRSAGPRDGVGSLRMKPSVETIRARKDRKRTSRKTPSIHNGTASSKADIFEARVASQVDEANSSDSDETFVYESNPPEPHLRVHRNHSRTPSVTSIHSQSERRGFRYDNHRVAGKRSMKFSNNPYNGLDSPTDGDTGTIRAQHPRNISRFGRTVGSNPSIYDQDSPFTQVSKLRPGFVGTRHSSRPTTPQGPRSPANPQQRSFQPLWLRKQDGLAYDFDGEGADDERMPLVGTVRTNRNRHVRRSLGPAYEDLYDVYETSWWSRFGGYLIGTLLVSMVLVGAISFLFMSNKPLLGVEIREIQNVLASEQELMLDMSISAINPNLLGVTISDMDINVFAKSKFLNTPSAGSGRSPHRLGDPMQDPDGHWSDGEGDSQTMLLGRVFTFDQALYFEGTPFRRSRRLSVGELRLAKPGNETEAGGSARWERVLLHPFELIVRGVLKYQLPVGSRNVSAAVSGSVVVHPEEGLDNKGNMRVEPTRGRGVLPAIESF